MVDYYAVLARKIREASDDPAKMREVVYEAARLALRWQVQGQWPRLSTIQAKGQVNELEEAIGRLEAEAAGSGGPDTREPCRAGVKDAVEGFQPQPMDPASKLEDRGAIAGNLGRPGDCEPNEAPARSNTSQQSHNGPIEPDDCHAPRTAEKLHPQPASAALAGLEAVARSLDTHDSRGSDNAATAFTPSQRSRDAAGTFEEAGAQSQAPPSIALAGSGAAVSSDRRENQDQSGRAAAPRLASLQNYEKNGLPGAAEKPHLQRRDLPPSAQMNAEADAAGPDGRSDPEPGTAVAGFTASRQSRYVPTEPDEVDAAQSSAGSRASRQSRDVPIDSDEDDALDRGAVPPAELAGWETPVNPGERGNRDGPATASAGLTASLPSRKEEDFRDPIEEPHTQRHDLPVAEATDGGADATGPGRRGRHAGEAMAGFKARRRSRYVPIESGEDDASDGNVEDNPLPADFRELVLVPDRARRSTYVVKPDDLVRTDATYWVRSAPHVAARLSMSGLMVGFHVVIAGVAIAALCIALWGRNGPVQTDKEVPSAARSGSPAASPDGTAMVAPASLAAAPAAALPFPRPIAYGVYAVRGDHLIELEQVQGTPVDPRTRSQLQIVTPVRTIIDPTKPAFVVFRRDLVSSAPEKVPVRIASRIAHSMIFDASGKPVVTTPETATWLIRDKGYDLRVSPLRESLEMVMLRPQNPEFSFPPGRYELMLGGQVYDFVVAGEVTDPAHCVEGVATARGPVFYECKPAQ
jgi:hypothetical protein